MISISPSNWQKTDDLEILFFFFQCAEECTNEKTVDTYQYPLHTPITLCFEILEIYSNLKKFDNLKKYFSKYIPDIIDELFDSIHNDIIVKTMLGNRLQRFFAAANDMKQQPDKLKDWILFLLQSCSHDVYLKKCQEIIEDCIKNKKNKEDLITYTNKYFSLLTALNFSREHVHKEIKHFFLNNTIYSTEQIKDFFKIFESQDVRFELLILLNSGTVDYLSKLNPDLQKENNLSLYDIENDRDALSKCNAGKVFLTKFDKLKQKKKYNINVIKYTTNAPDLHKASQKFQEFLKILQSIVLYFDHKPHRREIFDTIVKKGTEYIAVYPEKILEDRPFISFEKMSSRISLIIGDQSFSPHIFNKLIHAFVIHSEAINSDNTKIMLRNFWAALESLFSLPGEYCEDTALYSTLHIIQKTYILKIMRTIFFQIKSSHNTELYKVGINNFQDFIYFFAYYNVDSDEFKELFNLLSNNPLLRFRLYTIRKKFSSGKTIAESLMKHEQKIKWQLQRIYRARNMATHLGIEMPYSKQVINNLHNYFDYIVNFIICKIECNEFISDLASIIFQAKIDNQIHKEILKEENDLTPENYKKVFFGPDNRLISYEFEFEETYRDTAKRN